MNHKIFEIKRDNNCMMWPNNPTDAKSLLLSFIAGTGISFIILTKELFDIINPEGSFAGVFTLWLVMLFMFFTFLRRYENIAEGLEEIRISTQRNKN